MDWRRNVHCIVLSQCRACLLRAALIAAAAAAAAAQACS